MKRCAGSLLSIICLPLLGLVSCESVPTDPFEPSQEDAMWVPPEDLGHDYVEINDDWKLESSALHVTRDQSRRQVLTATAQAGAVLTSLRPPRHTHVATTARANEIYYDAYQNRFTLVGNPRVEQGAKVTSKSGATAKMQMYSDGKLVPEIVKRDLTSS